MEAYDAEVLVVAVQSDGKTKFLDLRGGSTWEPLKASECGGVDYKIQRGVSGTEPMKVG
jgi:hypothetical protein